ncbi:MAG: hypothetical protein LBQ54_14970 [Planctomycetaceae bacterium]|nr:hypothetical protein [Planctomycetaceae bacterium]
MESFPGEFTDTQIERVRRQSPLCRFVLIAGTLCEGEKRTGNVPSGVFRYYLWQWMEIKQEIDRFLKQKPTVLSQPQSMTNEEVATFSLFGIREWLQSLPIWKKYVAIQSDDPDMKNYLETLCFQERFQPVMRDKSPELVIFDSSEQPIELTAKRIFLWRNQFPAAHFAVLFTTPRADETETLLKNGADFVFAKPIL